MKTLLLLRHGKSSWKETNLADHDRPLKRRGINDALRMGEFLSSVGLIPDQICCSTAKRAKDTVKYLLETIHYEGEVLYSRELYHGYTDDYINILNGVDNHHNSVMVVGHNPGLEEFVSTLSEIDEWLPTAAVVQIELAICNWREIDDYSVGQIKNIWRPRELF